MKVLLVSYYPPGTIAIGAERMTALAVRLNAIGLGGHLLLIDWDGAPRLVDLSDARKPVAGSAPRAIARGAPSPSAAAAARARMRSHPAWVHSTRQVRAVTDWPDPKPQRDWYRTAWALARDGWLPRYDVVISSGPPWVCHRLARRIAQAQGIPWLADYRDLWSNGTYYPHPQWRRLIDTRIERRWLADAAAITAVTPGLTQELQEYARQTRIETIWNGYDGQQLRAIESVDLGPGRHIAYAGTWYPGKRDPTPLLEALASTPALEDVQLHLVGAANPQVDQRIAELGLTDRVVNHGQQPRERAMGIVNTADVAIILGWNDARDRDVAGGKIFELIGMSKPVLALGYPHGVLASLIGTYGHGRLANTEGDIADALTDLLDLARSAVAPDPVVVASFERTPQLIAWERIIIDSLR